MPPSPFASQQPAGRPPEPGPAIGHGQKQREPACEAERDKSNGENDQHVAISLKKCDLPGEFMNSGQLGRYQRLFFTSIIATTTIKARFDSADRGTRRWPSGSL